MIDIYLLHSDAKVQRKDWIGDTVIFRIPDTYLCFALSA